MLERRPSLGLIIGRLVTGARVPLGAPPSPLADSYIYGVDDGLTPVNTSRESKLPGSYIYPPVEEKSNG